MKFKQIIPEMKIRLSNGGGKYYKVLSIPNYQQFVDIDSEAFTYFLYAWCDNIERRGCCEVALDDDLEKVCVKCNTANFTAPRHYILIAIIKDVKNNQTDPNLSFDMFVEFFKMVRG